MIIINCEQGSEEWHKLRCGVITMSALSKIITSTGTKSAQRKKYMIQLLASKYSNEYEIYENEWMKRGKELEPKAVEAWKFITNKDTDRSTGFIFKDEQQRIGCSPDGIHHGLEIKCPASWTHMEYLINGKLPSTYKQQVQGCMYVTGATHWDFMSYHPKLKPFIITVERDDPYIALIDKFVKKFIRDMDVMEKKYLEAE